MHLDLVPHDSAQPVAKARPDGGRALDGCEDRLLCDIIRNRGVVYESESESADESEVLEQLFCVGSGLGQRGPPIGGTRAKWTIRLEVAASFDADSSNSDSGRFLAFEIGDAMNSTKRIRSG